MFDEDIDKAIMAYGEGSQDFDLSTLRQLQGRANGTGNHKALTVAMEICRADKPRLADLDAALIQDQVEAIEALPAGTVGYVGIGVPSYGMALQLHTP